MNAHIAYLNEEIMVAKADVCEADSDCVFFGRDGYGGIAEALAGERLHIASERLHTLWVQRAQLYAVSA